MEHNRWLKLLNDEQMRIIAYGAGRDYVEGVTGNEKNACAAVASTWLILRGVLDAFYIRVSSIQAKLEDLGFERFEGWAEVKAGDTLFAADRNNNNISDHVYHAVTDADDSGFCWVVDNQSPKPYKRNLVAGSKTAFWFGLREPEVTVRFTGFNRVVIFQAIRALYYWPVWNKLPQYTRAAINDLRVMFKTFGV